MLLKVSVNGQNHFVDAPNKATAKAYGKKQLNVEVTELGIADLAGIDQTSVVKIETAPAEKTA